MERNRTPLEESVHRQYRLPRPIRRFFSGVHVFLFVAFLPTLPLLASPDVPARALRTEKPDSVRITEKENGTRVTILKGQIVVLKLPVRISDGYTWKLAKKDTKRLRLLEEPRFVMEGNDPTGGSTEMMLFRFRAVAGGVVDLEMHYLKAWAKKEPPEKVFTLTVDIQKVRK